MRPRAARPALAGLAGAGLALAGLALSALGPGPGAAAAAVEPRQDALSVSAPAGQVSGPVALGVTVDTAAAGYGATVCVSVSPAPAPGAAPFELTASVPAGAKPLTVDGCWALPEKRAADEVVLRLTADAGLWLSGSYEAEVTLAAAPPLSGSWRRTVDLDVVTVRPALGPVAFPAVPAAAPVRLVSVPITRAGEGPPAVTITWLVDDRPVLVSSASGPLPRTVTARLTPAMLPVGEHRVTAALVDEIGRLTGGPVVSRSATYSPLWPATATLDARPTTRVDIGTSVTLLGRVRVFGDAVAGERTLLYTLKAAGQGVSRPLPLRTDATGAFRLVVGPLFSARTVRLWVDDPELTTGARTVVSFTVRPLLSLTIPRSGRVGLPLRLGITGLTDRVARCEVHGASGGELRAHVPFTLRRGTQEVDVVPDAAGRWDLSVSCSLSGRSVTLARGSSRVRPA